MNRAKLSPALLRCGLLSIFISALLAAIKISAGLLGDSYALIADGIESTTDVFSSSMLLLGLWFARQPADANHPYGHGRAETLSTFLVVAFLIGSATVIVFESVQHILTPHKTPRPFTLVVLVLVVAVKEALFRRLRRLGLEEDSPALEAESQHQRSDAISSLAAFVGISISLLLGDGWESADDWCAIIGAGIIYYNGWCIFRPALADLMDEHRNDELRSEIIRLLAQEPLVLAVEQCLLRKMGSSYLVDLRLAVYEGHRVAKICHMNERLQRQLRQRWPKLGRIFIEISGRKL